MAETSGTNQPARTNRTRKISTTNTANHSEVSPVFAQSSPPQTGTTRHKIATVYVYSFLGIVAGTLIIMLLESSSVDDIKNILLAESGLLSGPLGFIIGFYFKEESEKNKLS